MDKYEVKISLTIEMEGSTLVRQSESERIKYIITKGDVTDKKLPKNVANKIIKSGKVSHKNLIAKPCHQKMNICYEAYAHFVSDSAPNRHIARQWKNLSKNKRLLWHLDNICTALGGISYSFKVFED